VSAGKEKGGQQLTALKCKYEQGPQRASIIMTHLKHGAVLQI
jgi:hypothetical protein